MQGSLPAACDTRGRLQAASATPVKGYQHCLPCRWSLNHMRRLCSVSPQSCFTTDIRNTSPCKALLSLWPNSCPPPMQQQTCRRLQRPGSELQQAGQSLCNSLKLQADTCMGQLHELSVASLLLFGECLLCSGQVCSPNLFLLRTILAKGFDCPRSGPLCIRAGPNAPVAMPPCSCLPPPSQPQHLSPCQMRAYGPPDFGVVSAPLYFQEIWSRSILPHGRLYGRAHLTS